MYEHLKTEKRQDGWYWWLDLSGYRDEHGPFDSQDDAVRCAAAVFNPNA